MVSLDSTLGALYIGFGTSTALFGLTTIQLQFYLRHFPDDSKILKAVACTVWLAELGHQICNSHTIHWLFVVNSGNMRALHALQPRTLAFSVFFLSFIGLAVQGFFAFRLWRATRGTKMFSVLISLIVTRFCLSAAVGGVQYGSPTITGLAKFKPLLTSTWVCSAITDILVTFLLSYNLHTRRSGLGIYRTSQLVDRLITIIVATGMLTSISAILMTVCFLTMNNLVWGGIFQVIPRLFSNSMLTSLNSRMSLRRIDATDVHSTTNEAPLRFHHSNNAELSMTTLPRADVAIEQPH